MRTLLTVNGLNASTKIEEITRCFNDAHELGFWLDVEAPDDADYELLENTFKFHPLTIEDIKNQDQRPKVDEYNDYNFAVIFQADWHSEDISFHEHHLFVGANYLITVRLDASPEIADLQRRRKQSPELN